jgi:23S rRNA (uracil-5-)-methyltransferase RumA
MHLQIGAQHDVKRRILVESLYRQGHLEVKDLITVHSAQESGYRLRARFHVGRSRRGTVVGFNERGSRRLVDIAKCLQISPEANSVLEKTRGWMMEARAARFVTFELLESNKGSVEVDPGRFLLHFVVKDNRGLPRRELEELKEAACLGGVVVSGSEGNSTNWHYTKGRSAIVHGVGGIDYRVSAGSFFQINRYLLEKLVDEAASSTTVGDARVIDLYCGVGLFTLPLAKLARSVTGVESSASAIADARANVSSAGLDNVDFIESSAGDYAKKVGFEGVNMVVADPPRGGLHPRVVDAVAEHRPQELRYISCDPPALGRDAGQLVRAGLSLKRLVLLDLFPNTHHFETVAIFRRLDP